MKCLTDLVLFGARCQLPTLGIQLGKAASDALHTGVQQAVLIILCIEVILVGLPLVRGHQRRVLPVNTGGRNQTPLKTCSTASVQKTSTPKTTAYFSWMIRGQREQKNTRLHMLNTSVSFLSLNLQICVCSERQVQGNSFDLKNVFSCCVAENKLNL